MLFLDGMAHHHQQRVLLLNLIFLWSCLCLFSLLCVTALFITRAKKPYIEISGNIGIFPCTLNLQHHCQNLPILLQPPLHLKPLTTYIISTHGMVFFPNSSMFSFQDNTNLRQANAELTNQNQVGGKLLSQVLSVKVKGHKTQTPKQPELILVSLA